MRSAGRRKALISCTVLATLCLFPGLAAAQSASPTVTGPSSVERAVTLASPAVVFIDTSVSIHIRLIYQNPNAVSGLGSLDRTYSLDYATGSGFVVSPTGVVVTASHVVEPDEQSLRNYAANRLILEGYGYNYGGGSPFDQYYLNYRYQTQLLRQCYKGVACTFKITPIETVYSAVDIAQMQLPKGTPARILTSTGFENTDVAILQVNGTNMPTVPLADTATNLSPGDEVVALGFPGTSRDALQTGVTQPNKVFGRVSNVRPQGTSNLIEVDANIQRGMSGGPVIDDSGKVVGLISFSLIQSSGESGAKYLRTVDDIKAALADAGVTAERGTVDDAFAKAMDLFWANHFTAAVPELERVQALSPGHPLATEYLADAQAKAGTAADVPVAEATTSGGGGGFPVWAIGAIAAAVVVVLLFVVLASRRKRPAPAVAAVSSIAPPPSAVGTPAPPPAAEAAKVGFQPPPAATAPPAAPPPEATPPPPTVSDVEQHPIEDGGGTKYCGSCGHELDPAMRFCSNCGRAVGG
jgi:S1-C subfamily serine protease